MVMQVVTRSTIRANDPRGAPRVWGVVMGLALAAGWIGAAHSAEPSGAAVSRAAFSYAPVPLLPEPQLYNSASYRLPSFPGSSFETGTQRAWAPSRGSVQLFETPGEYSPGQPIRRSPRLALGFRSNGLRHAMEAIGIEAHICMAPIVRLRGKMADNGGISGTFWVSARCTFK